MTSGYLHPEYAQSLSEFGDPIALPTCGAWLLQRSITGLSEVDAMGPYPILACQDWGGLGADLNSLASGNLVCVAAVTDPFGQFKVRDLQKIFPEVCFPYKEHFIVDLQQAPKKYLVDHHIRNIKQAQRCVSVQISELPTAWLEEWQVLYQELIERHQIRGIARFSRRSFEKQLRVPGIVAIKAQVLGETVGMLLWYQQGDVAYYHLGAFSELGYQKRASYALFWNSIEYFSSQQVRWLGLGAGAGHQNDGQDGLTRFKRGWSTGTRTAYFCGLILNPYRYQQVLNVKHIPSTKFFPAYRLDEF